MGTSNYSDEFKRDAVQQIRVRGYPVREVSQRLGVSSHSLYKWMKLFTEPAPKAPGVDHEAENRRLKRELARVTEERDILKNRHGPLPACARYKQPVLLLAVRRAVADGLLEGQTPLKNVAHGLMRT
jgi:transposase